VPPKKVFSLWPIFYFFYVYLVVVFHYIPLDCDNFWDFVGLWWPLQAQMVSLENTTKHFGKKKQLGFPVLFIPWCGCRFPSGIIFLLSFSASDEFFQLYTSRQVFIFPLWSSLSFCGKFIPGPHGDQSPQVLNSLI
jgi:hypothetical protein